MLGLIVQTKRKYKSKKEIADGTAEKMIKNEEEGKSARLTKKLKRAQIRTPIKIQTVMYFSKKTLTKQLTLPKKKKNGSNSSKEVPKKQKNT